MRKFFKNLHKSLQEASDPSYLKTFQRFFKEPVKCYGLRSKDVKRISKEYFKQIENFKKEDIFEYCEELYQSGMEEEAWIAAEWSYKVKEQYKKEDIKIFEKWIDKYIDDWAKCDGFCNHTVGTIIDMYPDLIEELKKWSKSTNLWLRRASAVSLIIPAREGRYLKDIFEISDTLLLDKEDMVQKGYGWLLKETSKPHRQEIYTYVLSHKNDMPRTALRYAIEKMPQELRKEAMKK